LAALIFAGTMRPRYQVLTVVYAPPGANSGKGSSQVTYGHGSATGTTTSTSNSFKVGVDVGASVKAADGSTGADASFKLSQSTTDSSSVDVKKNENYEIKIVGPSKDGIDHDYDLFYLWLNPLLNVTIAPLNNIKWALSTDGSTMDVVYLYAAWLKNPQLMPRDIRSRLSSAGLTDADFAQILKTNPFTSDLAALDPDRFLPTLQSFPYEPPKTAADSVPSMSYSQQNSVTRTASHSSQVQYDVSVSVSGGIKLPIQASLKVTTSLSWTNTATSGASEGATQSAAVTVGGPAFGYNGPTSVLVYWDTVYSSFMFAFASDPPIAAGNVMDDAGIAIPHKEVTLDYRGYTLRTFTDSNGNFRFYGPAAPHAGKSYLAKDYAKVTSPFTGIVH
jgi:hypothetical protein